jgi:non-ribosomal peptide synthetase component F
VFLQAALAQPATPLLQLPLMDELETQLVLKGFNCTDVLFDDTALVHSSFARHAAAWPDAACVVFEGVTYSYAEVRVILKHISLHAACVCVFFC